MPISEDVQRELTSTLTELISCYGSKSVSAELRHLSKKHVGRPAINDFVHIRMAIDCDAHAFLEEGENFQKLSNKTIASKIAKKHLGQSPESTRRRIMRKLSKKSEIASLRDAFIRMAALQIAERDRPHADYFEILHEVKKFNCYADSASLILQLRQRQLANYKLRFGEPLPSMTILQVVEKLQNSSSVPVPEQPHNFLVYLRGAKG